MLDGTAFVVAEARLVVGEEDFGDEIAATADAGLIEDALEVLLNGVFRDRDVLGDLRGRAALQDQPGHVPLALDEPVGGHQERVDAGRVGRFNDDRHPAGAARDQT